MALVAVEVVGMTVAMTAAVQAHQEAIVVPLDVVAVMIGLTTDEAMVLVLVLLLVPVLVPLLVLVPVLALASGATVEDLQSLENRPLVSRSLQIHVYQYLFVFLVFLLGWTIT